MSEADRRDRIKSILAGAAELATGERNAFLDAECADDPGLRGEVESLLAHLDATLAVSDGSGGSARGSLGAALSQPKKIGSYTVIGKLGEGGMGVVYKATQEMPRRTVALKIIKPHMASAGVLERFRFETQVLAKLTHPGIAQIYDAGTTETPDGPQPYFAMELVRGKPLLEHAELRNLTLRERLALMQKIAEAVHHAHTRGVVHRDLKPGNILVTEDGEPKILDFGVARSIGGDIRMTSQRTEIGQLVGTLPYMSPEQVSGDPEELDARTDVYSLGIVTYELLTGHLPYELERKVVQEAMRVIMEVEPSRLSIEGKAYRGDVETIVGKALSKERGRRYQSASEFASDIYRYLRDEPVMARPASAMYHVRKFAKRHRMIAGGIGVAAVGITGGLGLALWQLGETRAAESRLQAANTDLQAALATVETERDRAEATLAQLQELTGALLDFEKSSHRLIGATEARRVLAGSTQQTLDELDRVAGESPWIRDRLAEAYLRLGAVMAVDETGRDEAARVLTRAVELHRELVRAGDAEGRHARRLADSLMRLSSVTARLGGTQPGLVMASESITIADGLPASDDARVMRAYARRARADVLDMQGRGEEAVASLQEAAAIVADAADPEGLEVLDARALLLGDLARLRDAAGQNDEASELYQRTLEIRRGLVRDHPSDSAAVHRLLTVLSFAANRLYEQGERDGALRVFGERLGIAADLVLRDPADSVGRDAVLSSHRSLAHLHLAAGDVGSAERSGRAYLIAARDLAERHPTDVTRQRQAMLAYEFMGDLSVDAAKATDDFDELSGHVDAAQVQFGEALATVRWLLSIDSDRADLRRDEARLLLKMAEARGGVFSLAPGERRAETLALAIDAYEQAVAAYDALIEAGLADDPTVRRAAVCVRSLGTLYLRDGRGESAVARLERADELHPLLRADAAQRKAEAYALIGDDASASRYRLQALEWNASGRSKYRGRSDRLAAERADIEAISLP